MTDGYVIKYQHVAKYIIIYKDDVNPILLQYKVWSFRLKMMTDDLSTPVQVFIDILEKYDIHHSGYLMLFTRWLFCLWNCPKPSMFSGTLYSDRVGPSGSGLASDGSKHAIPAKTPRPSTSTNWVPTYQGVEYTWYKGRKPLKFVYCVIAQVKRIRSREKTLIIRQQRGFWCLCSHQLSCTHFYKNKSQSK